MIGHQPLEPLAGVLAAAIRIMQQRIRFAARTSAALVFVLTCFGVAHVGKSHLIGLYIRAPSVKPGAYPASLK